MNRMSISTIYFTLYSYFIQINIIITRVLNRLILSQTMRRVIDSSRAFAFSIACTYRAQVKRFPCAVESY